MSSVEGRKYLTQDIQLVEKCIERCLHLYMNEKEVMNTLFVQDNIDPRFTEIVWQRLKEENQEFFNAYCLKLLVKEQIMEFNRLLSKQVDLMCRTGSIGMAAIRTSNGSHVSPRCSLEVAIGEFETMNVNCHVKEVVKAPVNSYPLISLIWTKIYKTPSSNGPILRLNLRRKLKTRVISYPTEDMQQPGAFGNSGSSIQSCVQGTLDVSAHGRKSGVLPNLFVGQNSNVELSQAINGKIIKTETGYASSSPFYFNPHVESRPVMGDASISPFTGVEPKAEPLNDMLLDGNASSFGFFNQLPQGFGDLAVDFCNNSELLESYCRIPILPNDANFVDSHGDMERVNAVSEGLRYQSHPSD